MTVYDDIPLTAEIVKVVADRFGIEASGYDATRLHGGEESAAYRLDDHVVRIGPRWRGDPQVEWCHAVAARAAAAAPQFLAPLHDRDGRTVIRVDGRPVTVWPYVAGRWADDRHPAHRRHAAELLARFHTALATTDLGPPPAPRAWGVTPSEVADVDLDAWLADFDRRHPPRQPLHGDYYAGNTLADGDRIVAVLDWDESYVGPPQREAAHAAWEWGDGLNDVTLDGAYEFLDAYAAAGGPGTARLDDLTLRQLIRERLRWEVAWAHGVAERGERRDADDQAYTRRQADAFWQLRP